MDVRVCVRVVMDVRECECVCVCVCVGMDVIACSAHAQCSRSAVQACQSSLEAVICIKPYAHGADVSDV